MRALAEWSAMMCESEYRPCVSAVAPPEMGGRKAGCENNRSHRQKVCLCGFFFCLENCISVLWPVGNRLNKGSPVKVRRRRATVMCRRHCQIAIAEKREGGSAAQSQETYKTTA